MTLFKNPRRFIFNKLDFLKGKPKNQQLSDIKAIIEQGLKNEKQLLKLLNHACTTTDFYKPYSPKEGLESFPVINKNIISKSRKDFQSSSLKNGKNRVAATSGSTGTPFKVTQDPKKVLRNKADTLYFTQKAGYQIGNKLYYFRLWKAYGKLNLLASWTLNIVPVDVFDLTDDFIKNFINELKKDNSPKSFTGYASAFEVICKYLEKTKSKPIDCNLKSAIAISESLSPYTRDKMKKYFNVNTVSRYSNVENGIIAQQMLNSSYFTINWASYYVEILSMLSDEPVKDGGMGRIVITDLFNFSMPMIRYDTGDIGAMETINGIEVLTTVGGRKVDAITNTKGEFVPNSLMMLVNNYHELNQCQLVQKSAKEYVFNLNIDGDFKNEKKFVEEFKTHLGNDANIKVKYVDEIPLLASGKRRAMVNEIYK